MNFDTMGYEKGEYRKGVSKMAANVLLRWALFWMEVASPILVFGYFYYSITMHWHFVFFATILSCVWCGVLYKVIDMFSGMRKYSEMWMLDGYEEANANSPKDIPEWVVNGTGSKLALLAVIVVGYTTGWFGDVWDAWIQYQLPVKDPIAGFWHMLLIYF